MDYLKKLYPILLIALTTGLIFCVFIFLGEFGLTAFIILPLLTGAGMSLIQAEKRSYKFIDKLLIGSLFFGQLASLAMLLNIFIAITTDQPTSLHPFSYYIKLKEYFTYFLVFAFISFLGGLAGIVIKGFYFLIKKDKVKTE
jgi:hypothetical protein